MRYWLLVLNEDDFTEQQAYEADSVKPVSGVPSEAADGDEVALAGPGGVFALGEVEGESVVYRRRVEEPSEAAEPIEEGWTALDPAVWEALVRALPTAERRSDWLVTLSIPIEAVDRAEAVRRFWSYVRSLGPTELPTFVAPYGREIEGTAFLLGVEHEQDPEDLTPLPRDDSVYVICPLWAISPELCHIPGGASWLSPMSSGKLDLATSSRNLRPWIEGRRIWRP